MDNPPAPLPIAPVNAPQHLPSVFGQSKTLMQKGRDAAAKVVDVTGKAADTTGRIIDAGTRTVDSFITRNEE